MDPSIYLLRKDLGNLLMESYNQVCFCCLSTKNIIQPQPPVLKDAGVHMGISEGKMK